MGKAKLRLHTFAYITCLSLGLGGSRKLFAMADANDERVKSCVREGRSEAECIRHYNMIDSYNAKNDKSPDVETPEKNAEEDRKARARANRGHNAHGGK